MAVIKNAGFETRWPEREPEPKEILTKRGGRNRGQDLRHMHSSVWSGTQTKKKRQRISKNSAKKNRATPDKLRSPDKRRESANEAAKKRPTSKRGWLKGNDRVG